MTSLLGAGMSVLDDAWSTLGSGSFEPADGSLVRKLGLIASAPGAVLAEFLVLDEGHSNC